MRLRPTSRVLRKSTIKRPSNKIKYTLRIIIRRRLVYY